MCEYCERAVSAGTPPPLDQRPIPFYSGEAAIYSPEYLARREGNANGAEPDRWYEVT